jgi:type IV pilus assembly protein PilY1
LDVTEPDPSKWFVRWRLKGGSGTGDFSPELGYSWSGPVLTSYSDNRSCIRDVAVFCGGYDPEEDFFPEAWTDGNFDGIYSPGSDQDIFDIQNPQHDSWDNDRYDHYNPEQNDMGRGIFIVDLWEGTPVFQVTYGENRTAGSRQTNENMKWCFPAGPSVISYPGVFVIYAADIYGQVWKVTRNPTDNGSEWQVNRFFTANPGSDQENAAEALSIEPALNPSDSGRKLFHSPDVSYMGTDWTDDPVLYFVTGDRVHPRYIPAYENRLYVVSDSGFPANETDLINLTCDELDDYADVNQDGILEYGDAPNNLDGLLQNRLLEFLYGVWDYPASGKRCRGWYRVLGRQGDCPGASVSHRGEMGVGRPTVFYNTVYFSTFQPKLDDWCHPGGYQFIYTIDYAVGSAAGRNHPDTDTTPELQARSVADTSRIMDTSGMPSDILMITRPEGTAAFICSGGSIVGLGSEDGTMIGTPSRIPSLPGGIKRLMWRMD